ncbi:multiheme c-type cytochrome [Neorhodopirellula pilleata]|uniref:Cytochrome c-552/4 domain-containing protein n=1 Tax=Neorhodopirellula pilleata TaxID=2714738 RepID=A0A5C6AX64_9BACT|nr:multiheme c-type cytochrome [Neorhodopirellula pilleata]TWU03749.1 hypothetical protein Pla100_06790 [Neorhodopirellula pilleata]
MKRHFVILTIVSLSVIAGASSEVAAQPGKLLTNASCATTTCHGNQSPESPVWARSLPLHLALDPHAHAGVVLRGPLSQRIVASLAPESTQSPVVYDNVLRTRCISCHVTVDAAACQPAGELSDEILGRGVSCESCHGHAGGWVEEHVGPDWRRLQDEPSVGFRNNGSLIGRAETCLRCHVGSRTEDGLVRDVNHDMIAAGHPALRFDLLTYHVNLPAHWDTTSDQEQALFSSSIRVREVGQAIGLAAAARLSAERASDYLKTGRRSDVVWPELADFDCFACHQSLSSDSYHLPAGKVQKSDLHISDGLPVWNAWHSILLLNLRQKQQWLSALSPQNYDPKQMAEIGPQIAEHFSDMARQAAERFPSPMAVLGETIDDLHANPPVDWHAAAIQFLRIEAVAEDLTRSGKNAVIANRLNAKLPRLEQLLRFDASDTSFNSTNFLMSPKGFRADRFRAEALDSLGHPIPAETP